MKFDKIDESVLHGALQMDAILRTLRMVTEKLGGGRIILRDPFGVDDEGAETVSATPAARIRHNTTVRDRMYREVITELDGLCEFAGITLEGLDVLHEFGPAGGIVSMPPVADRGEVDPRLVGEGAEKPVAPQEGTLQRRKGSRR